MTVDSGEQPLQVRGTGGARLLPVDYVDKNRVHLDVRAAPGLQGQERMAALETECGRLVALERCGTAATSPLPR